MNRNSVASVNDRRAKPSPADLAAAERLRALWDERAGGLELTQQRMGEVMGISQGAVSHYLRGRIPLNFKAVMAFARELRVDPRTIRDDLPEMGFTVRDADATAYSAESDRDTCEVPLFNARAAGGDGAHNGSATQIGALLFRTASLRRARISPRHAAAMYVDGDSMLPRLRHGDTVLYDRSDTELRDGRMYVVSRAGDEFVKRMRHYDGRWWMSSDNKADPAWAQDRPVTPEIDDFRVLGRVRWIGSWEP